MAVPGSKRALSRAAEGGREGKRRKTDADDWQPRLMSDLKLPSIYNRSAPELPAELFRKDLISAMKLPDSEPLASDEYWVITDPWKQEWERGVQVPVNPDSLPEPTVSEIKQNFSVNKNSEFKLPKLKYVRLSKDVHFSSSEHFLSSASARAEAACAYDLDGCDSTWLRAFNGERARAGAQTIKEDQFERVIEELEVRCWDKIQAIMKSEEGLGIEYDENVICDVCRSPDSEEGNEMVFCDSCNICVHQACYGITAIPSGQWLCRPCGIEEKPVCVLCPNMGGAMKCTPSGHKWAHVSCVLWIPEVSIGCAEKMEPITKISAIPSSRWSLLCVLCRERTGACIQCSVRTCKIAYHVTCAFKHGLEMRAIIEDEHADDGVKLRSYCLKHSVNCKKDKSAGSGSEEDESKRKRRKDMTSEEKSQARAIRLQEIEAEFDKHVSVKDISTHLLDVDQDGIQYIYNYWKLKRKSGHNRPLLPPKADENDMLTHRQEQADLDKMKMFVQLRQDLERVRNLCYMVSRREKLSRTFFRMREQTFHKQVAVLSEENAMAPAAMTAVIEANHGPSIYDRLYSHPNAVDHSEDFAILLAQIAGVDSGDEKKKDLNGITKSSKSAENPYKRLYLNGAARRAGDLYTGLSSGAESIPDRDPKYQHPIYSTTDDEDKNALSAPKKKSLSKDKENTESTKLSDKKKAKTSTGWKMESSSEEDLKSHKKDEGKRPKGRTLRLMEREMGARPLSGSESDELMPMRSTKKLKLSADIYSDSENSDNKNEDINEDKSSNATSDSQQHPFRTKAAVKEFIPSQKGENKSSKSTKNSDLKEKHPESDEDLKDKENMKSSKNKDYPTDLIVPQRQAAKKASENMRSNTVSVKSKEQSDNIPENKPAQPTAEDLKSKSKTKIKDKKENKDYINKDKKETSKDGKSSTSGNDVFEFEKDERDNLDILAYVPQRQAAKKAAAHIKSGMTKLPGTENPSEEVAKKKEDGIKKPSPQKDEEKQNRSPLKSSSISANNSSNSSSSSSNSSSDDEDEVGKKAVDKKSVVKSLFSPSRKMNDLPFLDKGTKVISSSSFSDSETHKDTSQTVPSRSGKSPEKKTVSPSLVDDSSKAVSGVPRKAPDKKLKTSDGQPEHGLQSPTAEREKPARSSLPLSRPSVRARTRSVTAGSRNLLNTGVGKSNKNGQSGNQKSPSTQHQGPKEDSQPGKLPFAQWKTNKKLRAKGSSLKDQKKDKEPLKKTEAPKITEESSYSAPKASKDRDRKSRKSHSPFHASPSNQLKKLETDDRTLQSPEKSSKLNPALEISKEDIAITKPNEGCISDKSIPKEPAIANEMMQSYYKTARTLGCNVHTIKSPKTPMDVDHKMPEPSEGQTPKSADTRSHNLKTSLLESTNKVSSFDIVPPVEFNELQEAEQNKSFTKPILPVPYTNRSIFSPQPTGKDTGSEFFDFTNDILAVDETVNDDGFNISQGNEEIMKTAPLSFFATDFLFKEDSKEDRGVRETLNLVEKLRMQMSTKKSNSCLPNENSDQDLDIKDTDIPLSTFTNSEACPKIHSLDESIEMSLTMNTFSKSDSGIMHSIPVTDNCDTTAQSDLATNENLKCKDVSESNKVWPSSENLFTDSSSTNVELEKEIQYGIQSREILYNPSSIQTEMHDSQLSESLTKESFLQVPDDKSYESNMETESSITIDPLHITTSQSSETSISMQQESNPLHFDRDIGSIMIPPESTPIPSPYDIMKRQQKWIDSELIPARRSSTSSSTSDSSISLNKHENEHSNINNRIDERDVRKESEINVMKGIIQTMSYNYPPCAMDPQYMPFSVASQLGPVSLFPSTTIGSQLPLSSPGVALFPPSMSFSNSSSMLTMLPKSSEESLSFSTPCTAAFTSSSHNMALTTAMIAPPTPKPVSEHSSTHDGEPELTPPSLFSMQISPLQSNEELSSSTVLGQINTNEKHIDNDFSPVQGKKSPIKPTRTSSRFSQIKSPGKSPVKSPHQQEVVTKGNTNRRGVAKGSRGSRSRGRPRGSKGSHHLPNYDMDVIYKKLAGTVYDLDFDDDITNDSINNLKSMRERRKSTDIHERKPNNAYRDSSQSPKFTSPSQHQTAKRLPYSTEIDLPPTIPISCHIGMGGGTPVPEDTPKSPSSIKIDAPSAQPTFSKIVQSVLPEPTVMRAYNTYERGISDAYNNLLGAFASGTADQQLPEIDEEMEKELHSALKASNNKSQEPLISNQKFYNDPKGLISEISTQCQDLTIPKVSLSDSRHQLKVKIKGPFLDANYPTSSVAPVIPQPTIPILEPHQPIEIPILGAPSAVGSVTSAMISGTSNLRRMRKKELLRQYCTQDMNNMDDPMFGTDINMTPPTSTANVNRTVITIPKAIASMTTIPTREDYKAVVDANMEKKRRKVSGNLIRDTSVSDNEIDAQDIRNVSNLSIPSQLALSYKRRGRISKPSPTSNSVSNMSMAPKLKIKIGHFQNEDQSSNMNDPHFTGQFKPPKKRLASIPKPTVEDLRRESMKFRRMVFANFDEGKKDKKKRLKSEKRKKKRDKRSPEIHVVKKQTENATKLIIRFARKNESELKAVIKKEEAEEETPATERGTVANADPFVYDPTAPDPLALDSPAADSPLPGSSKVSPIRLKLARGLGGAGYVMRDSPAQGSPPAATDATASPDVPMDSLPAPLPNNNKHCPVR